jgi:hypothetical protein
VSRLSPNPSYLSLKLDPSKQSLELNGSQTMKFGQLAQSMQLKKGQFGDISRNYLNVGLASANSEKKSSFME